MKINKKANDHIDIFITWVDGDDPVWKAEKMKYEGALKGKEKASADEIRFRSWDNLQYLFRGIEECMPWVHKIYFVTCGHIPNFLNVSHPKLEIIKHEDYIPAEYLPTFNSNVIEMNLHRIEGLSENFILFNDDTIPIQYVEEDYYFKNNMPCDEAVERILAPKMNATGSQRLYFHSISNNIMFLNKYFKKREVQKRYWWKWFNPKYGTALFRNLVLSYFYDFDCFTNPHVPTSMKKSNLNELWQLEYALLDESSRNKFRSHTDLTQYLIRWWHLCKGDFYPRKNKGKYYKINKDSYKRVADDIRNRRYPIACINEDGGSEDFDKYWTIIKAEINAALEEIFPNKSSFEL